MLPSGEGSSNEYEADQHPSIYVKKMSTHGETENQLKANMGIVYRTEEDGNITRQPFQGEFLKQLENGKQWNLCDAAMGLQ